MLTNYQLMDKFLSVYEKNGSMISIGTAGEMLMANSTIAVTDPEGRPTRHAGRGGVGAVMGSKGVKIILLDGTGTKGRTPADPEAFKAANKEFVEGLRKHPVTGQGLPAYGTNVLTNVINEAGAYPYANFSKGQWENASKLSGEAQAELESKRGGNPTHGCHRGCVMKCSGIYHDKDGNYLTKQPEYETVWSHGGNCGIDDLDAIAMMDRLDDDYGLDTIEMGATIGVAMAAGVIPFGDAEAAINLVHEVGKGSAIGRLLGAGTAATAKAYGIERAPVVKNQAMPAYDPRAVKGVGVTYATTPHGRRPHRRVRRCHQHPEGGRRCGSPERQRPGGALPQFADRHSGCGRHGHVPVHRLCGAGSARDLSGSHRPAQRLLRLEPHRG